jgi:hypothetical protein
MLRGVVKFKPLGPTSRLCRSKRFLERGRSVRIAMVQHHRHPFGAGIVLIGKHTHRFRPIGARAPRRDLGLAPAGERLGKQEQIRHAAPLVFVILTLRLARLDRQRQTGLAH